MNFNGKVAPVYRVVEESLTEFGKIGILVNSVSLDSVSPSNNRGIDYTEENDLSFMGRTGFDRENANLICFLVSDESSYISVQNIQKDGCRKKK